jgi:hypothetical protein
MCSLTSPRTNRITNNFFYRRQASWRFVLAYAAHILGFFGEDIAAALALADRALQLNPSYARGWDRSGWLRL